MIQSNKTYLSQTNSHARKIIPVNLSLYYKNVKVNMTRKLQSAHVERRVCLIGFSWRVRKRLFNRHDKAIGLGEEGARSAEFVLYGLLGRDAAYCGADLPTFRWNLLASSNLVDIYRLYFHLWRRHIITRPHGVSAQNRVKLKIHICVVWVITAVATYEGCW